MGSMCGLCALLQFLCALYFFVRLFHFICSLLSTLRLGFYEFVLTTRSPLVLFTPLGLSSTGPLWGDPDPGRGGEAHHPESPEPSPTPVGSARLRVCVTHTRSQSQSHSAQIQQLQRTVPEQLGMCLVCLCTHGKEKSQWDISQWWWNVTNIIRAINKTRLRSRRAQFIAS